MHYFKELSYLDQKKKKKYVELLSGQWGRTISEDAIKM